MISFDGIEDFHQYVKEYENGYKLDLSSGEDLSIALMNLISIEEHLYFSAAKTNNRHYLEVMAGVRQIRKSMQGELVHDTEGEVWCICKHLLATCMRLMETGNKVYGADKKRAYKFFDGAQEVYNLFWAMNLKLIAGQQDDEAKTKDDKSKKVALPISVNFISEPELAIRKSTTRKTPMRKSKVTAVAERKSHPSDEVKQKVTPTTNKKGACKWQRFSKALNANLDCCHE